MAIIILAIFLGIPLLYYFKSYVRKRNEAPRRNPLPDRSAAEKEETNINNIAAKIYDDSAPKTYDTNDL